MSTSTSSASRQHGDGRRRSVDAPLRLGLRHALDAMHARFEFQPREDAAALDLGDDFLEAAERAFARRDDLDAPAVQRGIALIHAEEIAGEQRRLVAAGAGADFQDGALFVGGVLGQQRELQLLVRASRAARRASSRSALGQAAHLGVERRIVEQRLDAGRFPRARRDRRGSPRRRRRARRVRARARRRSPNPGRRRAVRISSWRRRMRSSLSCGEHDGSRAYSTAAAMARGGRASARIDARACSPHQRHDRSRPGEMVAQVSRAMRGAPSLAVEQSARPKSSRAPRSSREHHRLHRADRGRRHRQRAIADARSAPGPRAAGRPSRRRA